MVLDIDVPKTDKTGGYFELPLRCLYPWIPVNYTRNGHNYWNLLLTLFSFNKVLNTFLITSS